MDFLSPSRLAATAQTVRGELRALGFSGRVERTEVVWCALPHPGMLMAQGFFMHGAHRIERTFGWHEGNIYIPSTVLIGDRDIRDILRHEYGHAVAHWHRRRVHSPEFTAAFGGRYSRETPAQDRAQCVSDYAATMPAEDFAETFLHYVRRRGRLPRRASDGVRRKWRFIAGMATRSR